jgi:hypothetical protein
VVCELGNELAEWVEQVGRGDLFVCLDEIAKLAHGLQQCFTATVKGALFFSPGTFINS